MKELQRAIENHAAAFEELSQAAAARQSPMAGHQEQAAYEKATRAERRASALKEAALFEEMSEAEIDSVEAFWRHANNTGFASMYKMSPTMILMMRDWRKKQGVSDDEAICYYIIDNVLPSTYEYNRVLPIGRGEKRFYVAVAAKQRPIPQAFWNGQGFKATA